ncbi:MAG: flagellar hook-length control protein FliK [Planctomycetota bacterium]
MATTDTALPLPFLFAAGVERPEAAAPAGRDGFEDRLGESLASEPSRPEAPRGERRQKPDRPTEAGTPRADRRTDAEDPARSTGVEESQPAQETTDASLSVAEPAAIPEQVAVVAVTPGPVPVDAAAFTAGSAEAEETSGAAGFDQSAATLPIDADDDVFRLLAADRSESVPVDAVPELPPALVGVLEQDSSSTLPVSEPVPESAVGDTSTPPGLRRLLDAGPTAPPDTAVGEPIVVAVADVSADRTVEAGLPADVEAGPAEPPVTTPLPATADVVEEAVRVLAPVVAEAVPNRRDVTSAEPEPTPLTAGPELLSDSTVQTAAPRVTVKKTGEKTAESGEADRTADPTVTAGAGPRLDDPSVPATSAPESVKVSETPAPAAVDSTIKLVATSGSDAKSGQPAPVQVDGQAVVDRVTEAFDQASASARPVRVRLTPPELGAVRVEVIPREQGVTVRLTAETSAATKVLGDQARTLNESLTRQGISVESIEVNRADNQSEARNESRGDRQQGDRRDRHEDERGDGAPQDERAASDDDPNRDDGDDVAVAA